MFRAMRRFKQQLDETECIEILKSEKRGVLSLLGDDGYPYGIPLDHWYCEADGALYFHGAKAGHKIDALSRCSKVSYCVHDGGKPSGEGWALVFRSVIVFGRAHLVTDTAKAEEICRALCHKFTDDEEYIQREVDNALGRVQCIALVPEHVSGKRIKEE